MAQIILDSNNNLIQGDFDNATLNNRTKLQTTTTNATTNVYVVPNGSSTSAGVSVANNSSLTNASKIVMATNGSTDTQIISGVNGSGTYLPLSFYTNNALAMQLSTAGNLVMATGGITFNANPGGGTQATLNDYEVGTWTPNVGGNATYTLQAGTYVKVGSMVVVSFAMAINVIGTGSTTNIFGFPFTCVNITGIYPTGSIAYFSALNASVTSIVTQMQVNTTNCTFATTSAATTQITNTASVFKSGTNMYGTIAYQSTN